MSDRAQAAVLAGVGLRRGGVDILSGVDWVVRAGEHWLVLGPNGSGKTSLLALLAGQEHPTSGELRILGKKVGRTDLRQLRARIGIASPSLSRQLRPSMRAVEVVLTGLHAALEAWWHAYGADDVARARMLLAKAGLDSRADHEIGTLSSGELRQVQIARALMADPEMLLLDEPTSGLDLGAREEMLQHLGELLAPGGSRGPVILVTHHLEEIPAGVTHALLLSGGRVVASGTIDSVLDDRNLSECFGLSLKVLRRGDRWATIS